MVLLAAAEAYVRVVDEREKDQPQDVELTEESLGDVSGGDTTGVNWNDIPDPTQRLLP